MSPILHHHSHHIENVYAQIIAVVILLVALIGIVIRYFKKEGG